MLCDTNISDVGCDYLGIMDEVGMIYALCVHDGDTHCRFVLDFIYLCLLALLYSCMHGIVTGPAHQGTSPSIGGCLNTF